MANIAVVQISDNVVINKIVAEPTAPAYDGTYFVEILDGVMCDMGWIWDGSVFINPNPPVEEFI